MLQRALQYIREDLYIGVRMGAETACSSNPIVVDHQQVGKAALFWIPVIRERESVP